VNIQQTYEILKNAVLKDFESKDNSHNHTFGVALGIIKAVEELGVVESVGESIQVCQK